MTSPIQNPIQEHIHREYIKRIQELTQEANLDILDIEANYRKDILPTELEDFKTSLACAVEVHITRGSREGEPPPRRLPP